ncbi:Listeria/Bacterioides repeat-containing protein [Paenibacillus sp. yr247]|uniref:InlB B-repeat-containing protein n=1 Tax=Paenibacillus sp. yr247 TaxID=1761880 RepID=UPI000884723B|nr:InlB B-repeat-containing protein [Paenibacillus sp. yr247]SDP13830.1 Listeria/Bacterioides repeat-containing protein [Paenibacillus sp. yr247]
MSRRMKQTKRMLSIFALSGMLLNVALPQTLTIAHAATNPSQQSLSSGTFNADEVKRILDGLTPEQKANINKLTGAENTQKIHVNPKDLRSSQPISVIVQFNVDPAKIQIIKQSMANGGAAVYSTAFTNDYAEAQKKVEDSHAKFKSFVSTQPAKSIVGGKTVNTSMRITREFSEAFNGVALSLPPNQVETLANNPEVASVWSVVQYQVPEQGSSVSTENTGSSVGKPTSALTWLGIDKLQAAGYTGIIQSGPRQGQAIKVGVLDTGIDYNHPDLYKVTHDANGVRYQGHDFVNNTVDASGNVTFVDDHDPMETTYKDWVAAKSHPDAVAGPPPASYKNYITEHGSHVSGTIAANTTNNNDIYSANGVAPNVDLYGYRVLGPGGRGTSDAVLNGIDQAAKDHMDVINLSLGATINDPLYPTSIAINNATIEGVVCAVAAGNAGPGQATVGSPGTSPLAITVGASTIPESIPVMTITNGSASYQARLFGRNFKQEDDAYKGKTFPIVDVGAGTAADYSGMDMTGKIALVKRGGEYMQTKMANAHNAGAAGMIIWDNVDDADTQGYIPNFLGVSMDNIYSVSLTQAQGKALSNAIALDPNHASVTFPAALDAPIMKNGDELASFSSTGPVKDWTIKPDVVAPGVDIMSTAPYDVYEPQDTGTPDYSYQYMQMSGTSMATPHVAGIAALVLAAHPDYSPADVKTALMNTAKDINTESKTYSVYQVGAGRVDPARAIQANVKIQVLDKAYTYNTPTDSTTLHQVDNLTGSLFFGFKGRGEGATNGSDDVISSKDFNVTNTGVGSKTFNLSTKFISTKFALSHPVGSGTGNDVKIDFSTGGTPVTSITVGGGSAVKTTAIITVPSNAIDGTYEGYIYLVNAADASESYRIPFTITVSEKGIDMNVIIKAFTLPYSNTGNWNPDTSGSGGSYYSFSVNSAMENMYLVLKDKNGNYLGVIQKVANIGAAGPGVVFGPLVMLQGGLYLPFTKPYNGSLDQSGIATKPVVITEGSYSVEMIATDSAGKHYKAEDTVYVDTTAPTIAMDSDSKPGIYEIDPTGYQSGQEIKGFYGTVYDSNVDIMKNNGETSVPSPEDLKTPVPVDQALNTVWGYQDSAWPTVIFKTDAKGRFHFGITPEDITSKGSNFWIYPSDYSGEADTDSTSQQYYFIKKGSPYVTFTSSGGVDAGPGNQDKTVVDSNKPFKATIAVKNGIGMTGGKFTLNSNVYTFSNIRLSDEYKNYLISKGIDPTTVVLTVGQPYVDTHNGGKSTDIAISGITAAGALDQNMNILEADVTYTSPDPISGPLGYFVPNVVLTMSSTDTQVPAFGTNVPYVRQAVSMITGGLFAEAFKQNSLSGAFTGITTDSGAKVTVTNQDGKAFTTDNPTSTNNTVQYAGNQVGTYAVIMDVSDKPYSVELSMPGHFKGYLNTPVIGSSKFGYQSGSYKDIHSYQTPSLLGGDVNGDNVIDMKDVIAEINAYLNYKNLISINNPVQATTTSKATFLNDNRNANICWKIPGSTAVTGIDYYDFYYIFKNFGQVNQNAIDAGIITAAPIPQLTVDQDTTISTPYGGSITLAAGDDMKKVMTKLNFAGPPQTTSGSTLPTYDDLKKGSTISLIPNNNVYLDDVVWRNAIKEIDLTSPGSTTVTNITYALISNTSDKAVSISAGYFYFDPFKGPQFVPSKITLHGSLFTTTGTYTVRITADGYAPVNTSFTIAAVPIPTPTIPLVTDPTKAHLGNDLTFTFTDNANWRNGINKIVVKTRNFTAGLDITNLTDGSGNKYYDISQPGQITFKADLFKTNVANSPTAAITPGGAYPLAQLYLFEVNSTGADSTIYPLVKLGNDPSNVYGAMQAVGYGITFDSQGGYAVDPIAVGYRPSLSRNGSAGNLIANSSSSFSSRNPLPVRSGYAFAGWYNVDPNTNTLTTLWDPTLKISGDIKVAAKWQMNVTQNYSPVDQTKPDGLKFDGTNGAVSGKGWVLGEGNLDINIPDYATNVPWLTSKNNIAKIEATFYKTNSDGTTSTTPTTYTLDPSTFNFLSNVGGSGTLSFTTATSAAAPLAGQTSLGQKFAFSEAPAINPSPYAGYQITVTSTTYGQKILIPDVKLGYRRHIDLNGGTLKNPSDTFFYDTFVNGKLYGISMESAATRVTNGNLSMMPSLYLDSAGTSGKVSPISQSNGIVINDNQTFYISWVKTPPTVSKDIVGNIVGSDITLPFTDDGTWRNNIKKVSIGSKELVLNTDYKITYDVATKKGSITLDKSLFIVGQKVNVVISSEGYLDTVVTDQVIGYQVTFDSNGGDAVAPQIVDSRVTKPLDPTKVGYKFIGWYKNSDLTTPFDFASIITGQTILYAKYALATSLVLADTTDNCLGNDITLEFGDADWAKAITDIKIGGTSVTKTTYSVTEATYSVTKATYKVDIASSTITLDKRLFTKAGDFTITISATDYADVTVIQKVINGYNVHFVLEGAPFVVKDQIVARRITQPVVTGYDLAWFTDVARTFPWDFTNSIYSDKTLYGKWSISKFTVKFDRQDGGFADSQTADYNTTITAPTVPTRTGYVFGGWYKDAECTIAWNFATDKVIANTIVYAKWNTQTYTITFDSQGGSIVPSQTADYNTTTTAPTAPTRTGYTFGGWYLDAECTIAWDFATYKVTANTILYAKWNTQQYTITFDSQGGSTVPSQTADYNTTTIGPTVPTRTGYTFGGWYMDAECTTAWDFATGKVTADTTLYAKWIQDTVHTGGGFNPGNTDDKDTKITLTLDQATKAVAEAKPSGVNQVQIVIPDKNAVSSQNVVLQYEAVKVIANAGMTLSISTSKVVLSIPSQSLNKASEGVNFTIQSVKTADKQQIAGNANKQSIIKVVAGNNPVSVIGQPMKIDTNLQNTPVTLTLPLGNLSADQAKDLAIYIEHSDGTKELVKADLVAYDDKGQLGLRFTTNKFSTFSIIQVAGVDKYFSVKTKAYVHGYSDGTFKPEGKITRAEVAAILVQISTKSASGTVMTFTDVAVDYWANKAIKAVTQMGLMNGYEGGNFRGNQEITRAELASIIARLLGSSDTAKASKFSDIADHWAKAAIDQVAAAGIIHGYEDGTFKPSNSLTRAEAVTMINHYLGRGLKTPVTQPTWSDVHADHWAYNEIESASHDQ